LIFVLFLARALPFPYPGSSPFILPRNPAGQNRSTPTLVFNNSISFTSGTPTFNLTLTQFHSYLWKFNVTMGSVGIRLTDPRTRVVYWTVGPQSPGQWHLNGTGFVSFNWTAPTSTYYSMIFDIPILSSSSDFLNTSSSSSCEMQVWDLNLPAPLRVIFS
jgi:hypothetical protein